MTAPELVRRRDPTKRPVHLLVAGTVGVGGDRGTGLCADRVALRFTTTVTGAVTCPVCRTLMRERRIG